MIQSLMTLGHWGTPAGSPERELSTPSAPVRARRPDAEEDSDSESTPGEQLEHDTLPEASPIFGAEDGEQGFFSGERLLEEGENSDDESSDADDQDKIDRNLFDDSDDDLPGSNHNEGGDQL